MFRVFVAAIFAIITLSAAYAQIAGSIGSNFGPSFNRKDFGMGFGGFITGNAPTPPSCNGTINLSTGCVQPMLGVI